jgi:DNA ligase (NAD+)
MNYLRSILDIYRLHQHRAELEEMEGFGKKSVDVLLKSIASSKARPFRRLLPALGLKEIGPAVSEILIEAGYTSIDALIEAAGKKTALEDFTSIHGIGPRTARAIIDQFADEKIISLIDELKNAGLIFQEEARPSGARPAQFAGQSWCVTGSFAHFKPRELAIQEIKNRGGRVVSAVSAGTTHLLAGESAGSKLAKAEKLGCRIISEQEFLKMLGTIIS